MMDPSRPTSGSQPASGSSTRPANCEDVIFVDSASAPNPGPSTSTANVLNDDSSNQPKDLESLKSIVIDMLQKLTIEDKKAFLKDLAEFGDENTITSPQNVDPNLPPMSKWYFIDKNYKLTNRLKYLLHGDQEKLPDYLLLKMVKLSRSKSFDSLYTRLDDNKPNPNCLTNECDAVFKLLAYTFDLSFASLKERYYKAIKVPPKDYVQSVDKPQTRAYTHQEALHSFATLLCPVCKRFDCNLHDFQQTAVIPEPTYRNVSSTITQKCSEKCFILKRNYPPTVTLADYKFEDQTMLNVLLPTFDRNYCDVSKSLRRQDGQLPLTCEKVFAYDMLTRQPGAVEASPAKGGKSTSKKKKTFEARMKKLAATVGRTTDDELKEPIHRRPCVHPLQDCNRENCTCIQKGVPCEKFCSCPKKCKYRFPGCNCFVRTSTGSPSTGESSLNSASLCDSIHCICHTFGRECDPELCKSCGAEERLMAEIAKEKTVVPCQNIAIQNGDTVKLLLSPSDMVGWGAFTSEHVAKGQLIAEYVGEVITVTEAEARHAKYEKEKISYLFKLDDVFDIDSTVIGNYTRFINHADPPVANCEPRVKLVLGENRIGFYALRDIEAEEELFFNYGYDDTNRKIYFGK